MSIFNIDYPALVYYLLPVRKRTLKRLAWINSLIAPFIYVYNLFYTNRANNLYYLQHTSQVCFLLAALNDIFDPTLKRIYYSEAVITFTFHAYINVPAVLSVDMDQLTAVINKYRLPGRVALEIQTF
jgi:hypothetical protein